MLDMALRTCKTAVIAGHVALTLYSKKEHPTS
jgi:hypothetical protein